MMHPDTPAGDAMAARTLAAWRAMAAQQPEQPVPHSARYLRVRAVVRFLVWGYGGAGAVWLGLWAVAILAGRV